MGARAESPGSAATLDPVDIIAAAARCDQDLGRVGSALARLTPAQQAGVIAATAGVEGGLRALVDLREHVLAHRGHDGGLDAVEHTLRDELRTRFSPVALDFCTIEADAPRSLLDQLIDFEAVHPIRDHLDLLRRLDPVDRRCFALFHPDLGDDPLVFVEVALTAGLAASVQDILDGPPVAELPRDADTATFYSITGCQPGLQGVAFGAELLHRSMDELAATTTIDTFATLSPIPGFVRWLGDDPLEPRPRLAACARYLLTAKRGSAPLDPVARFHLGNGARLERLNPGGDTSLRGLTRYLGITANYLYEAEHLDENKAAYQNGVVVAADAVTSLVGDP